MSWSDFADRLCVFAEPCQTAAVDRATPPNLRWDDLRVLLAAYRAGTLLGAAAELETHASTVGRRLEALEQALGHHLFDRTSTGLEATELAESLVPLAEAMESRVADVARVLEGRETEPEGWVRVTAPPGMATYFVAPLLPQLYARHPGIRVELVPSVDYADLTRREADIALRSRPPSAGDLVTKRLIEVGLEPYGSPELVAELGKLRSLDQAPWITWAERLAHLPDARWIAANVCPTRVVLTCGTFEPQLEAARVGLGLMLLGGPYGTLTGLVPARLTPALRRKLPAFPRGAIHMVGHRALREVPRIAAVWSFLDEAVNKSPPRPGPLRP
jgi:DNA-binding transcriptional LysR family regulator